MLNILRKPIALIGATAFLCAVAFMLSLYVFKPSYNHQFDGLLDSNGKIFNASADLGDKTAVVYFGFSFCPDVCTISLYSLDEAYAMMDQQQQQKIQPIFVSLDPDRDTPKILQEYQSNFDMPLIALRPDEATLKDLTAQLGIKYTKRNPDQDGFYTFDHSNIFITLRHDEQPSFVNAFPQAQILLNSLKRYLS